MDDNATNREILIKRLASWGRETVEAPDGVTALACMAEAAEAEKGYDAAIIDMQMPEMDGLMLGKAIRQDARFNRTFLLMMTSLGQHVSAEELAVSGYSAVCPNRYDCRSFGRLTSVLAGTADTRVN